MNLKAKHFAIKRSELLVESKTFVAVDKHVVAYTQLPQYIKRYLTRDEAALDLRNEREVIVDLRHQK